MLTASAHSDRCLCGMVCACPVQGSKPSISPSLPCTDLPLPPTPDEKDGTKMKSLPPNSHPPAVNQPLTLTMVPPRNVPPRTLAGQQRLLGVHVHHSLCSTGAVCAEYLYLHYLILQPCTVHIYYYYIQTSAKKTLNIQTIYIIPYTLLCTDSVQVSICDMQCYTC